MPKPPEIALNSRKELAAAASKLVLAVCVIGLAFVQTYGTSTVAFTAVEIREILLLGVLISTVPMAAALVLLRSRLCNAVLAFVVVLSVASVNLIHTDLNVSGSRILVAFAAVLIGSGLFAAFEFVDSSRWLRGGGPCGRAGCVGAGDRPSPPALGRRPRLRDSSEPDLLRIDAESLLRVS